MNTNANQFQLVFYLFDTKFITVINIQ